MESLAPESIPVYLQSSWNAELDLGTRDAVLSAGWIQIVSESVATENSQRREYRKHVRN